jgi:Domain of unknown function (DUF932)
MHACKLMLHTGARTVAREQLGLVPLPPRTASYVPIAHDRLLTGVQETLTRAGLSVVAESYGLSRNGARFFGLMQLANGHNAEDFGLVVGVRNSHDQSFPAGIVVGASVFVCDNLSFSGEIRLARKHTSRIEVDMPQLIERAVGQMGDLRRNQEQRFAAYKQAELTDTAAHDLIIQALDARIIGPTKVPAVLKEWRQPRHPEFREGKSAWRLFSAFTEEQKGNLDFLPKRTTTLHGLLDVAVGLANTTAPTLALPAPATADTPELATAG